MYTSGDLIRDLMMGPRPVLSSWKLSPRHTRRVSVHGPSVVMCASSAAEVCVIDTVLQPDVPALNCQNKQRRPHTCPLLLSFPVQSHPNFAIKSRGHSPSHLPSAVLVIVWVLRKQLRTIMQQCDLPASEHRWQGQVDRAVDARELEYQPFSHAQCCARHAPYPGCS